MKKHWYYITEYYCPLCGKSNISRERRYGRRPKKYWNRHSLTEQYDWCDS